MKLIQYTLFYMVTSIAVFSCNKDGYRPPDAMNVTQLLTAKPWKLISYGFDGNHNGRVDTTEEAIQDCERDNLSIFQPGGSGIVLENSMICTGDEPESHFSWTLTNNDTVIDFNYGYARIVSVSKDQLILTQSINDPVPLLIRYVH